MLSTHTTRLIPLLLRVPTRARPNTMLQSPIPLQRHPNRFASPRIPAYLLYSNAHYELCWLAWNQPVVRGLPPLPHLQASASSNVSQDIFTHAKAYSARPTQRWGEGLVSLKETSVAPLQVRLRLRNQESFGIDDLSIFLQGLHLSPYATRSAYNTTRDCEWNVSIKSTVYSCLPLAPSHLSSGWRADQGTQVLRRRCMPHQV